jgi:hypothetical protein
MMNRPSKIAVNFCEVWLFTGFFCCLQLLYNDLAANIVASYWERDSWASLVTDFRL